MEQANWKGKGAGREKKRTRKGERAGKNQGRDEIRAGDETRREKENPTAVLRFYLLFDFLGFENETLAQLETKARFSRCYQCVLLGIRSICCVLVVVLYSCCCVFAAINVCN